jgi:hypothetical protein
MRISLMMGALALFPVQDVETIVQSPRVKVDLLTVPAAWGPVTGFEAQSADAGWCLVQADAEQPPELVRWQATRGEVQELLRWSLPEICTDLALGPGVVMLLGESALWSLPRAAGAGAHASRVVGLPVGVHLDLSHSHTGARGLGDWLLLGEQGLHAWRGGSEAWSDLGAEYTGISAVLESERGGLFLLTQNGPVQILPGVELFPRPSYQALPTWAQGLQLLDAAWPERSRGRQIWLQPGEAELRSYEVIQRGTKAVTLDDSAWLKWEDGSIWPDTVGLAEDRAALFLLQAGRAEWNRSAPDPAPAQEAADALGVADLDSASMGRRRAAQAWFADTSAGVERLDALRPAIATAQLRFSEAPGMNFRPWMGSLGTDLGRLHVVWALDAWRASSDQRLVVRARLLLELAAASVDPSMRVAALDSLSTWPGELDDPDQLLLLMEDSHPGVRQSAARAIAMRGLEEGGAALVKALGIEGDLGAAAQIAGAVRALGSWSALVEGTARLPMVADRARLWKLFEGVRELRAIESLAWTTRDSSANFRVRAEAARVLGSLGSVSSERGEVAWEGTDPVRKALARAVDQDQSPLVCEAAATALASLELRLARD